MTHMQWRGRTDSYLFILNTTRIYYVRLVGLTSTGGLAGLRGLALSLAV